MICQMAQSCTIGVHLCHNHQELLHNQMACIINNIYVTFTKRATAVCQKCKKHGSLLPLPKPPVESAQMHITSNAFSKFLHRNRFTINTNNKKKFLKKPMLATLWGTRKNWKWKYSQAQITIKLNREVRVSASHNHVNC